MLDGGLRAPLRPEEATPARRRRKKEERGGRPASRVGLPSPPCVSTAAASHARARLRRRILAARAAEASASAARPCPHGSPPPWLSPRASRPARGAARRGHRPTGRRRPLARGSQRGEKGEGLEREEKGEDKGKRRRDEEIKTRSSARFFWRGLLVPVGGSARY